jgi:hypothetical protein
VQQLSGGSASMSTTTLPDRWRGVLDQVTRPRLLRLAFLITVGLVLCAVAEQAPPLVESKVHQGDFNNDFLPDFDISRLEISMPASKSPTLLVWAVPPYVGLQWP